MTPLKYKDLKAGMIVAFKDGRTGRLIKKDSGIIAIKWSWRKEVSIHASKYIQLYHPHTTETTYMDGVQVVRFFADYAGRIRQVTSTFTDIVTPFRAKPLSVNCKVQNLLKIDRKISRVRNAK